ncbi:MAG: penicillin-binding protein [Lachnospiraceae bacterium]|nr:penicillin-binding protein [Lachnospiraceae bacterium]
MFDQFKDKFLNIVLSREFVLILILFLCSATLVYRCFDLQIVHGEEYVENFQLTIEKDRSINASRGIIYDRNGVVLAYNELAYSVTIEDVYESGSTKNRELNNTIYQTIKLVEQSGDKTVSDFNIILDSAGNYKFNVSDSALLRFLADVYGHSSTEDLAYKERNATAEDVMSYLCDSSRYGIGSYIEDADGKTVFTCMDGYTKSEILKIVTIRYAMSANSYQKYIPTTIATDVNEKTVAVISENSTDLDGVEIAEDTIRKYNDSIYFSQIIGYTGKISSEKLAAYKEEDDTYASTDQVGLSGIEASMESELRGQKGSETIYVDNTGKEIESTNYVEPVAGNDIYLTIDSELQKACYQILEQKIAGIVVSKIINAKEYVGSSSSDSSDIKIPIYDTYISMIENHVIDISHFYASNADETEIEVSQKFDAQQNYVIERLREELMETHTAYRDLTTEYQAYMLYIVSLLNSKSILPSSNIDTSDATYLAWKQEESISLSEYLKYCIAQDWIDVTKLNLDTQYADTDEIFAVLVEELLTQLQSDEDFQIKIYRFMIKNDLLSGREICQLLIEQHVVSVDKTVEEKLYGGSLSAYQFMVDRITNLEITPAQLALEPCTGSMVVTDVTNGDVLACVSYPSYDNNLLANSIDAEYYASLLSDQSKPLYNYATQERTAPGSTFKMVTSTAGLMEGVITTGERITCTGIFDKITPSPHCWIYPSAHGSLSVAGAIQNSCNDFFYEVGYRLGTVDGAYDSEYGLSRLAKYADLYGLSEASGIEIEESDPQVSDSDAVRSAIGQGTNNFTTAALARYVTAVANSGTVYQLTLVDKITDHNGTLLEDHDAEVRNTISMDTTYWTAIHSGMRAVVSAKAYYENLGVNVAGKTGTAQQSTSHPNHALFVSYAPYENPEIACAVRIANGYSSDYAAQAAKDLYAYYYETDSIDHILTGKAATSATAVSTNND